MSVRGNILSGNCPSESCPSGKVCRRNVRRGTVRIPRVLVQEFLTVSDDPPAKNHQKQISSFVVGLHLQNSAAIKIDISTV